MEKSEQDELTKQGLEDTRLYTKRESKWVQIRDKIEDQLLADELNKEIDEIHRESNKKVLELAKKRIAEEKEKFK